jgi:hypothetical protein
LSRKPRKKSIGKCMEDRRLWMQLIKKQLKSIILKIVIKKEVKAEEI